MKNITVDIQSNLQRSEISNQLNDWANLILNAVSVNESYIETMIVDEAQGEYYNMVFRKRTGPTNVLSFPDESNGGLIVLCDPVIIEESHLLDKSLEERYFQVFCL